MSEENNKKKVTIIITSILLLVTVVIGVSYAYFSAQSTSTTKTVTSGTLAITYNDNTSNSLLLTNMAPIYDSEISTKANKIAFSVQNTGNLKSYVDISITNITMDAELSNLEFKWALYETNSSYSSIGTKVSNGNFRNVTDSKQLLTKNIEIASSGTKYYSLYIWISESEIKQNDLQNKSFSGQILIEGNQNKGNDLLSTVIKTNNPIVTTTPDFSTTAITDEGLIQGVDEDGETYYFRGAVEDNYVKINGLKWKNDAKAYVIGTNGTSDNTYVHDTLESAESDCDEWYEIDYGYSSAEECKADIQEIGYSAGEDMLWRIVRINGDGTIRLISDGSIGKSAFNTISNNEKYVGYTYDNSEPNIQDGTDSTIKTNLENWYNTNMTNYNKYISNTRFCNDTTVSSTSGNNINYEADNRLFTNKTPSFNCENTTKTYGGEYDLKVGLVSADEVSFAGGKQGENNTSYYLYGNTSSFWNASPSTYASNAFVWGMDYFGGLIDNYVDSEWAVRPTINLKSDILYTKGNGTKSNPYVIE